MENEKWKTKMKKEEGRSLQWVWKMKMKSSDFDEHERRWGVVVDEDEWFLFRLNKYVLKIY